MVQCLKYGFAASFFAILLSLTNRTSTRFLLFSMVFPNIIVIHEFKNVFLKLIVGCCSQGCIEVDVLFQPRTFLKLDTNMNLCYLQSQALVQLEVFVVYHIMCFVIEIWDQFVNPTYFYTFWGKRVIVMQIVEIFWVFKVNL